MEMARNYPMPRPDDDKRFTFGVMSRVATVLENAGFPALSGRDMVDLQSALFGFLYEDKVSR